MSEPLLRKTDQLVLGGLTLLTTMLLIVWVAADRLGGVGRVQIEEAAPLHYQFLVDVNHAEWPELAQLPGVGETLARRIVAGRQERRYRTAQDLLRVNGIGPRKLAQIQRHLLPLPDDAMMAGAGAGSRNAGG